MQTKILTTCQIEEAVSLLKKGEVVALPTETVYGLAADARNDSAIHKIFMSKGRPSDHPLIVHIDSFDTVREWAEDVPVEAQKLAEHFWPGPLTMVLKRKRGVSNVITGGLDTVALRVPKHPIILEVIKKLGNAIVAPSANTHKKTSPTKAEHVLRSLDGKIAAILDAGACNVGIESTIIDLTKENPVILRPGVITPEMIERALNTKVEFPFAHNEKVSGNMQVHYQPDKPLFLVSSDKIEGIAHKERNIAVVHYSEITRHEGATYYQMPKDAIQYSRALYDTLHVIDNTHVAKIYVEQPPALPDWAAICDRLLKASAK